MQVSQHLVEVCKAQGDALEPELLALADDDYSPRAMDLSSRSTVWSELARDFDAIATRAAGSSHAERRLDEEIADL